MKRLVLVFMAVSLAMLCGCEKAESTARKAAHKAGDLVGKGATEFFGGVGEGVKIVTESTVPDVLTAIKTRTSVRQFDATKAVSDEQIEKILRAGMAAPSAMNRQPWAFVVVKDKDQLARLAEKLPNSRVGNGASLAVVVCGLLDNGLSGRGKEYWIHDCSAASENILLAAHGLGLGAVWTGVYPGEERVAIVREILAIPEGYMPLNVIPIGYPAESPKPKDKWDAAKVHTDRW